MDDTVWSFHAGNLCVQTEQKSQGEGFAVEGYISTTDRDKLNDVVTMNCLRSMVKQLRENNIKLDFEHEALQGDDLTQKMQNRTRIPVGRITEAELEGDRIKVKAELNPDYTKTDSFGDVIVDYEKLKNMIQNGFLDAFSIGYVATETKEISREGESVRVIDDLHLINVALTGNPVNPYAELTSFEAVAAKALKHLDTVSITDTDTIMKDKQGVGSEILSQLEEMKSAITNQGQQLQQLSQRVDMAEAKGLEGIAMKVSQGEDLTEEEEMAWNAASAAARDAMDGGKAMDEEDEEEKMDDEEEEKEYDEEEMKSLKKEMKALKKQNEELKSMLNQPQLKGFKERTEKKSADDNDADLDQFSVLASATGLQ